MCDNLENCDNIALKVTKHSSKYTASVNREKFYCFLYRKRL